MLDLKILSKRNNVLTLIFIILCFILLIYFTYNFTNGYHFLDIAQNIKYLDTEYNISLIDYATNGQYYNSNDLYNEGINMIFKSFFGVMLLSFCLGYYTKMLIGDLK